MIFANLSQGGPISSEVEKFFGLSEDMAIQRLQEEGPNELPAAKRRSSMVILAHVASEPMILLLIVAAAIYFAWGDLKEALLLCGWVFVVIGITLYQEHKTERALESLRDLTSPRALVIRDGSPKRIPGREVVREDIIVLTEGDRVPADAFLLSSLSLFADESLLTGESNPVRKGKGDGIRPIQRPGGDDLPFVYSGTLVVQGRGTAKVLSTGPRTEIGKIGKSLQTLDTENTLLQRETRRWVWILAILGISLCIIVAVVYGITRHNWLGGLLVGVTLAMSIVPEEIPVVLTVFLALGAWRISKQNVLTRRVPALETLGSTTVLCVDKTGTLTLNKMSVAKLYAQGQFCDLLGRTQEGIPEEFHEVFEFSILASQADPFDPMEKAIYLMGERFLAHTEHLHEDWKLIKEYPLAHDLLAISRVWKSPDESEFIIAAKGSPEAIADLCHLSEADQLSLSEKVQSLAQNGLRVLGVAKAHFQRPPLPGQQHDFEFQFVGLLGFEDPVRQGVPESIQECHAAGIRVVMITGDYPGTAMNIARKVGLKPADQVITGPDLDAMSDEELKRKISFINIFARVVPEQKLRIVQALKANGEIVAMTGDGVNDAPALKAAHIGIAMGGRGTDVAREAAALILVDDDFSSLVSAIRMGRRIFDNIKKAMAYILAIHVPIAGLSLIPVILQWPLVLLPVHIVFLQLIIDPACSIVFEEEPEDSDIMQRPPRNPKTPLFRKKTLSLSLLQGLGILLITLIIYRAALLLDHGEGEARALTFTTFIIANLGLIFTTRSSSQSLLRHLVSPNRTRWWISGGALVLLGLVLYLPMLRNLFHFSRLHGDDLLLCLGSGVFSVLWFEGLKIFRMDHNLIQGG
ncbi:MAG: cation-translocating P-type ATPase [Deltaproteobacteria bacterium]|nr:cation-translocating P-type ATPase [Deltaproteobacteria bacterium]